MELTISHICQKCQGTGVTSDIEGNPCASCNFCVGTGRITDGEVDADKLKAAFKLLKDKLDEIKDLLTA